MKNSTVLFALAISVFLLVIGQYFLAFMSFVVFVLLCTQIAGQQSIRQEDQLQKKILEEEADKNGKKATEDGTNQRMRQSLEPCIPALSIANTKGRIGMSSIHTNEGRTRPA